MRDTVTVADISDILREAVELAQVEFSLACAADAPQAVKEAAAIKLERAVVRLSEYILSYIIPAG
jgi:hypothetical protein